MLLHIICNKLINHKNQVYTAPSLTTNSDYFFFIIFFNLPHKKIVSLSQRPWDYVLEKQIWPEKRRTGTILTVWYEEMFWYDNSGEKSFQASDRWSICWQTATYALIQKQVTTPRDSNEHQHICIGMAARLTSEFNRKSHPYIRFILFQQRQHIRSLLLFVVYTLKLHQYSNKRSRIEDYALH